MKTIPLTQGKVALVDDSDFEFLSKWKWYTAVRNKGTLFYAARNEKSRGKHSTLLMHQVIMNSTKTCVDHADGNGLNNQRFNLRICTYSENQRNRSVRFDKYKGVWFARHARKWTSQITESGNRQHLGYFDFSTDAAIAYNEAAKRIYGEFARLNQIPD